jgi:hypothetical protein
MTAALVFAAVWATLGIWPETPVGRFLHRLMVEAPAARLARVARRHALIAMALMSVGALLAWFGEGDGLRVLSMAAPETWAWLMTFEVGVYFDALAALVAASSAVRVKGIIARLPGAARRAPRPPAGAGRAKRSHRRSVGVPANDDEDRLALALAS